MQTRREVSHRAALRNAWNDAFVSLLYYLQYVQYWVTRAVFVSNMNLPDATVSFLSLCLSESCRVDDIVSDPETNLVSIMAVCCTAESLSKNRPRFSPVVSLPQRGMIQDTTQTRHKHNTTHPHPLAKAVLTSRITYIPSQQARSRKLNPASPPPPLNPPLKDPPCALMSWSVEPKRSGYLIPVTMQPWNEGLACWRSKR